MKILVKSLSLCKYQIVNIDHVNTHNINLDFNMYLSVQNPKLLPTIGNTCINYTITSHT